MIEHANKCKRVLLIQYKAKAVFRLRRLFTAFVFVFLLLYDVKHEVLAFSYGLYLCTIR